MVMVAAEYYGDFVIGLECGCFDVIPLCWTRRVSPAMWTTARMMTPDIAEGPGLAAEPFTAPGPTLDRNQDGRYAKSAR